MRVKVGSVIRFEEGDLPRKSHQALRTETE